MKNLERLSVISVFSVLSVFGSCVPENQARGAGQGDSFEVKFSAKTREEVCKEIFEALRAAYLNEQASTFMSYVSRDYPRDYTTLREAIDRDCRTFDIRVLDFWLDRVTSAGNNRLLDFRWEKQYDERTTGRRSTSRGTTTFIFRVERGGYKLYDMQGDVLFGISLPEAGGAPDLTVVAMNAAYDPALTVTADIKNQGQIGVQKVRVRVRLTTAAQQPADQFIAIPSGQTIRVTWQNVMAGGGLNKLATVTVDPINEIAESDEFNNERSGTYPDPP
jgi:hypothetical protein